jgi:hypothetical protein
MPNLEMFRLKCSRLLAISGNFSRRIPGPDRQLRLLHAHMYVSNEYYQQEINAGTYPVEH